MASLTDLLTAAAVRERCTFLGNLALDGETEWFRIRQSRISDCARLVADTCRTNYPSLEIPYHSRWRHFVIDDTDLWQHYLRTFAETSEAVQARTAIDLVFISVLLDAGAGPDWCFMDPVTGRELKRSEGLAAASIDFFFNHLARFSANEGWYLDPNDLCSLTPADLSRAFQHSDQNPLVGVRGRLQLLKSLGTALSEAHDGAAGRPGDLYDRLVSKSRDGRIHAAEILHEVLRQYGSIWPNGLIHHNVNLGDCGYHPLLCTADETHNIVPFHKLSQWLSYSLIEPLQWGGLTVVGLDQLTGLPEYRNGGLFLDTGVLLPVDPALLTARLQVTSQPVVEWRALTVYLLDLIASEVRSILGKNELPLASILQGGTWSAGRCIAGKLRGDGSPPIDIALNGTVF